MARLSEDINLYEVKISVLYVAYCSISWSC